MGLDVVFNKQQAIDAGMRVWMEQNGHDWEVEQATKDGMSLDYIAWLKEQSQVCRIPGEYFMSNCDDIGEDRVMVRANKWGQTYAPLTTFLSENNISWEEQ